jgi:TetR/AcrR family transcriptional repressor of mexJK operon
MRFIIWGMAPEGKRIQHEPKLAVRAGRPTRAQQAQRHEELLSVALDIFLERGFEQATMEEIATCVGMSKRTVYAYYDDKPALFKAAVRRAITIYTIPREAIEAVVTDDLEESLVAIGRQRVTNMATPVATKLQRILGTQSFRFPELFNESFEKGAGPVIDVLCGLFERYGASREIAVTKPARAAASFLSLVVGGPTRILVSGNVMDDEEIDERIRFAVGLFLNGVRCR